MKFLDLVNKRFSVRHFSTEPVSEEQLNAVLEAVRLAPSACNKQPWKFLIVRSEEAKARLRQCYNRDWFTTAPMYIVCLRDARTEWVRPDDQKPHGDIDVAIATEHLCLAAAEQGLGTCWVCNFDVKRYHELFPMEGYEPVALIPIGHPTPDCPHPAKIRKDLQEIIEWK
ncbi:MAG: nitroreductase family protein [Prevotella sp.]|jgi:nitroreductase